MVKLIICFNQKFGKLNHWLITISNSPLIDASPACFDLWQNMYIWFDGIANPCDADYKSLLSPGSLKTHSIKEIWTGEKMKDLRKEHRNNKRNNITPCDRCGVHVAQ